MAADQEGQGMTERYVVFSHGQESEPWGSKIAAMAEIAREEGFHVESVDYRGIDDPQARVTRLLAFCTSAANWVRFCVCGLPAG
jgi:hypothetical protein